jgi:hypothetical protein
MLRTNLPEGLYCVDCHTVRGQERPSVPCLGTCDGDGPVASDAHIERLRRKREEVAKLPV